MSDITAMVVTGIWDCSTTGGKLNMVGTKMADTTCQLQIEAWIRDSWLPATLGGRFEEESMDLTSGGCFRFDAVSDDRRIVVNISTASVTTSTGGRGTGKIHKIRSDLFFLLLVPASRRLEVLTEPETHRWWLDEQEKGRVPDEIEFLLVELPWELRDRLTSARTASSQEMTEPYRLEPVSLGGACEGVKLDTARFL